METVISFTSIRFSFDDKVKDSVYFYLTLYAFISKIKLNGSCPTHAVSVHFFTSV
jgi:hypothetical protein